MKHISDVDTPGVIFRRMREGIGLMQRELAEKMGITPSAVSGWENDASIPRMDTREKIAEALGVTVRDLPWPITEKLAKRRYGKSEAQREKERKKEADEEIDETVVAYLQMRRVPKEYPNKRLWLINARRNRGFLPWQMARMTNISERYYRLVELGEATPPEPTAKMIARVLAHPDVTVERLLEEKK